MNEGQIFYERLEYLGRNDANQSRKSDKFYEVEVLWNGGHYIEVRRWGRYGTKGQTKEIRHWTEYLAIDSAMKQLGKKREKGYTDAVAPLRRLASTIED